MGIRGLNSWIQWTRRSSKQTCEQPSVDWTQWEGKTIGIDILGFLYKAKAQKYSPVLYLAKFIAALKKCNVRVVPVFDGKPPEEKKAALKQRSVLRVQSTAQQTQLKENMECIQMSEVQRSVLESALRKLESTTHYLTSDERDEAKQLFYACGIVPLNATGEADNVLAYFSKHGLIDAVISNDMDLLARGVQTLLVPDTYALPGDASGWSTYRLDDLLTTTGLTYSQFVEMCVLMGCDYTVGQKSLPYRIAYWSIRYGKGFEHTLRKHGVVDMQPYERAIELLCGVQDTREELMGAKQWEKLEMFAPSCEIETLETLKTTHLSNLCEDEYRLLSLGNDRGNNVCCSAH